MRAYRNLLLIAHLAIFSAACAKCAPGQVGDGVARLTVRNVGALANILEDDTTCGFASPDVKYGFTTEGTIGGMGSATWTISGCAIDLSQHAYESTDCNDVKTTARGKVTVSAKRTLRGTLTGDREQPVIPMSPDAVTVEITSAEYERFVVESTANAAHLWQLSGKLSAKIQPRLAASASNDVCSIPTRHALLSDIKYENASVYVDADGHQFDVDVPTSNIRAVNGTIGDEHNKLSGSIVVWDDAVGLPDDGGGLDPDYDPMKFEAAYACTDDLKTPVSFTCGDVEPKIAQGAARLTIRAFGAIAHIINDDTHCGFSSPAAMSTARMTAPPGSMGDVTVSIERCTLDVPQGFLVETTCTGVQELAQGKITVTGTKKVSGRLTGDPTTPVVPINDSPATVELTQIDFEHFRVDKDGTAIVLISGSLAGTLIPRLAMDTTVGACSLQTPVARFRGLSYGPDSQIELHASAGTFGTMVDASNLDAVNGAWAPDVNMLRGTITVGGKMYSLPTDPSDDGAEPDYDQARFDQTWMTCNPKLNVQAPFECDFTKTLAQGTAQLTVQTLGTIANLLDQNSACGFSSPGVLAAAQANGTLGDPGGTVTLSVSQPCTLSFPPRTQVATDCNGKITYAEGTAMVTGTKTIAGYISGDPAQPAVPTTRDPAVVQIAATMQNFKVWSEPSDGSLEVLSGTLSGTLRPRTAIDITTGACSIPTPVAAIDGIAYQGATVRLISQGKTFDLRVNSSNLAAVNGSRDGVTNTLTGTINLEGHDTQIPVYPGLGLMPNYSQAAFDASYACTPNLAMPASDADCNMKKPLGEGTARLLIQALGAATSISNADSDCGYSANLTHPSRVVGDPGQMGSMEWTVQSCDLSRTGRDATRAYETDCLSRGSYLSGGLTVSGMRHVDGLREQINLLFLHFQSIRPVTPEAVTVNQAQLNFAETAIYDLDAGQQRPARAITLHSGQMTAVVHPITGERDNDPGKFDVPTKVARMQSVSISNAPVTILYLGKTFNVHVDQASLTAFNGSYGVTGEKNVISGSIVVEGQTVDIPPSPLDPDFNQQTFDARYACTDHLARTVPAAP